MSRVLSMYATVQEAPPDHRGGYNLGRDELVVEESDYDRALGRSAAGAGGLADHRPPGRARLGLRRPIRDDRNAVPS